MKKKLLFAGVQVGFMLVLGTLLLLLAGASPLRAINAFIYGIFGNMNGFGEIFVRATPLIFIGLGISTAFKTGYFNIGAEGQFYIGALAATATALAFPGLAGFTKVLLAIFISFICGGIWAFLPAFMKSRLGISETISTIMFNYIAIMIVGIVIRGSLQDPEVALPQSPYILDARLPEILPPTRLHAGFLLALACVFIVWFLMYRTTLGFEMRMSGSNHRAATCVGIPVTRSLVLSALLSGGLAGLAGMSEVLGIQHRLLEGISNNNGYTAILVALLAANHPIGVLAAAIGLAALQVGANTMQRQLGVPSAIVSILIGFIVLILLSRDLPAIYREHKREKKA